MTPSGYDVYYSERGQRTSLRHFRSESEACAHLTYLLQRDGLLGV